MFTQRRIPVFVPASWADCFHCLPEVLFFFSNMDFKVLSTEHGHLSTIRHCSRRMHILKLVSQVVKLYPSQSDLQTRNQNTNTWGIPHQA